MKKQNPAPHGGRGEKDNAEVLYEQAHKIDPDHSKVSLTTNANPLPALLVEARQAQWSTLEPGLAWRRIEAKAYGVRVTAWAAAPHLLAVEVVQADGAYGTPAAALRAKNDALLVVNGGFFDMDAEDRLTPSGLLIIDGQVLRGVQSGAGSGVLIASGDRVTIDRSEDFVPKPEARSGFQSGPLLVDPGGVLGIKLNDFNRVPRTAVCLAGDEVVIVVVEGGLSLYELAELLITPATQGGFGCERALNLDGGPSTQAALASGNEALEIKGLWNLLSAIQVRRR